MSRTLPIRFYIFLLCALLVAHVSVYRLIYAPHVLTVSVLKVGKGSATLLRSPHGKTLLVDAAADASIVRALGNTLPMWQRKIDAVILTGAKASSVRGLPDLKHRYAIPMPLSVGTVTTPYGMPIIFDAAATLIVIALGVFTISNGTATLLVSSTTSQKTYILK